MSKVAIKGASTGTGTFTIESPATNNDRTLTLPDETGTVATESYVGTQAVGVNQTWQTVTRSAGVTYTNTTGRPIVVAFSAGGTGVAVTTTITVDGLLLYQHQIGGISSNTVRLCAYAIIPNGSEYVLNTSSGGTTFTELR